MGGGRSISGMIATVLVVVVLTGATGCGGAAETTAEDLGKQCDAAVAKAGWSEEADVASTLSGVIPGGRLCQLRVPAAGDEWLRSVAGGDYRFCQSSGFVWLVLDGDQLRFDPQVFQPDLCSIG